MNLKALYESKNEKINAMDNILSKMETENRAEMAAEEIVEFDKLESEVRAIEDTIVRAEKRRDLTLNVVTDEKKEELRAEEVEERAFDSFLRGTITENRADGYLTQGNNGSVVPKTIANRIITAVKDQVDFMKYANVIFVNGTLAYPVYTDANEATYIDEVTESDAKNGAFTTIDLTGYVIEAISIISKKMVTNVDFDLVSFVVNEVVKKIVNKLEKEFINGTTDKITGIISTTNTVTAASATAITYDELVKTKHKLKQAFQSNGVWVMKPETYTALCLLKDGNQQPYFKDDEYKILGRPVLVSDNMPAIATGVKSILFGDLSGYTIKMAKTVEVNVLNELYARKNSVGIQGIVEVDGKITDIQKIVALQMA